MDGQKSLPLAGLPNLGSESRKARTRSIMARLRQYCNLEAWVDAMYFAFESCKIRVFFSQLESCTEILALKHKSMILRKWSNPVSGSRKSQASSPWDKQQSV